jgi:hypothetical protein
MGDHDLDLLSNHEPLNKSDKREVMENARERLALWKKRFLVSYGALLLGIVSVYPFLFGHSLHVYWESVGKYLLLCSMVLLLPFVYCGATTWTAWIWLRDLQNDRDPSVRDS